MVDLQSTDINPLSDEKTTNIYNIWSGNELC